VLKFGGSSVGTPERIQSLVEILKSYYRCNERFAVVFSAFSGVTDALLAMGGKAAEGDQSYREILESVRQRHIQAAEALLSAEVQLHEALREIEQNFDTLGDLLHGVFLIREASLRTMDYIISFGERNSAFIISKVMLQAGIPTAYLDARKLIQTNDRFGNAQVDFATTNAKIVNYFSQNNEFQSVTGFIGATESGVTTTLGRGGSDYTAAIFGAALNVSSIEIWTDVDGVLTADPRKVKKAFTLPSMTYSEAMEMSHFGAKVIYPPTIQPALNKGIPLVIKNTFNPDFPGTIVSDKAEASTLPVKGLSSISEIALLTLQGSGLVGVPGIAGRLFNALANAGISIILITQGSSEHSITFAIPPQFADAARKVVELEFLAEIQRQWVDSV